MKTTFALWGLIGLFWNILILASLVLSPSVSVGSSAYAAAVTLIWIGGMVFFGLATLMDQRKPVATEQAQ